MTMETEIKRLTFRANPDYEAVPYNLLANVENDALSPWQEDPESYGLLHPRSGRDLPITAISQDTALLFLTLQKPGLLPDYVTASLMPAEEQALAGLVLDRVLEIAAPNGFISGPEAASFLGQNIKEENGSKLAQLSRSALRYGHALKLHNPLVLSSKLYSYNRLPATPYWFRQIPDRKAVIQYLGLEPGGKNEALLERYWRPLERVDGWIGFAHKSPKLSKLGTHCKIFISPKTEVLPEVFDIIIEKLAASKAFQFKIGEDVYGLLRPDKLVAYFHNKEALLSASESLSSCLNGLPVHGVPFTAEIGGNGLLSWGIDPEGVSDIEGRSWRHWITNRLAAALINAGDARNNVLEPWRFALERLQLDGVDPNTFVPTTTWKGVQRA